LLQRTVPPDIFMAAQSGVFWGTNRIVYLEHVGDGLEASVWVVWEPSRSRSCNSLDKNGSIQPKWQPILAKPNRKLTGELVEDEERIEVSQLKPAHIPDQQTKQRIGWPSKDGQAHLPMLRRTTAPTPSYCGRARNLRTTCRGFSMDANLCSKLLVPLLLCASTKMTPLPVSFASALPVI
jgi:hypothetical protein